MPRVFISATSVDLKSYRQVVTAWAKERGYDVVVQDEFPVLSDYDTIVQLLRDKLAPCDAVIHLAGLYYGFEPTNRPEGEARRSYTQLEFELGKELRRQVFRFVARPDYRPDREYTQTDEQAELQRQHRARLMQGNEPFSATSRTTGNELYYEFTTPDDLRKLLDQIEIKTTVVKPNNLPLVGSLFKGRDEFLEQLRSVLVNRPTHIAAVTAKQAIHGLGGVGKTRVAVEYAKRFAHEYTALLFITADSPANLARNLANLCGALVLNLPEREAREQEVQTAAALRWLREHAGWFLIVDDVDTPEAAAAVEEMLQRLDTGHIVVTSRLAHWGGAVQELSLDVIGETAAQEFLLERTAKERRVTPADMVEAAALAHDLGCLPLALEQAGAFICALGVSFAEYRADWQKHDADVVNWHDQREMKYPRSVATTWETSFSRLNEHGRGLLNILGWLAPDPIPRTMLDKLTNEASEPAIKVRFGLAELAKYSFLEWSDAEHSAVEVHRLVQEIAVFRLTEAHRLVWLQRALRMVDDFIPAEPNCYDVRSWPTIFVPGQNHIAAIVEHADARGIATPTARLMGELAGYLYTRGSYAAAEPLLRRALALGEAAFGPEHPMVAIRLNNLAQLLQDTNRLAEAEPLMRRALAIDEASFGPEHPNFAIDLNNLATLLQATNRLAEAEPLMRRSLAIDEASLGPEHPKVAIRLNNLAQLLKDTNRLEEAEPLMRRALEVGEASFGPDHPTVALRLNNLAQLLQDTNRLAEAEPMFLRAWAIDEASFGPEHPDVARDLNNLARLLQATNRLEEAEPLRRRALAIDEASFGPEHPNVARDVNNLAQLLQATKRLEEAEPLMRRALAIDEVSLGPEHPHVARDLNNLAQLLQDTNRLAEAEPLMRRALAIDEASLGPEHPKVAIDLNNLAALMHDTNRLEEAEPLMGRALVIFQRSLGREHPNTETVHRNYLQLLQATGLSETNAIAKLQAKLDDEA